MKSASKLLNRILLLIFILIFFFASKLVFLYTKYLWFGSLDYSSVFSQILTAKIFLFVVGAASFFIIAFISIRIAKSSKSRWLYKVYVPVIAFLSLLLGSMSSSRWNEYLFYMNPSKFTGIDPIFQKNIAFYVFSLPFIIFLWNFIFISLLLVLVLTAIAYLESALTRLFMQSRQIDPNQYSDNVINPKKLFRLDDRAKTHLFLIGALIFFMLAIKNYLNRFSVLYSSRGIVFGAGYTDAHIILPVFVILIVLSSIIALFFILRIFSNIGKRRHVVAFVIIIYILTLFIGQGLAPNIVQHFKVSPNEIELETPYLRRNIEFTRSAYDIDNIAESDFPYETNISPDILEKNSKIIDNIRLWDWRPLKQTYKQLQEIRLYYDFQSVDIDRYYIDGRYTQVMISPRELEQDQLPVSAQTWMNKHLVYTHGYGVAMSPVNKFTREGMPDFIIKDIPPKSTADFDLQRPEIYFGELTNEYVITNTKTEEFDYPKGDKNIYTTYEGNDGIRLDSFFKKIIMLLRFSDFKILLSDSITSDSRILFNRNIIERISTIAPFLSYDNDPYIVIADGKLFWIIDAYTTTDTYPYSEPYKGINYIRNSVKVVVDAYDGDVSYYVMDDKDPIINTYKLIFPELFRPISQMPKELRSHIRYPETLFLIQAEMYATYHMKDEKVFYNKEDLWQIPDELYESNKQPVTPYYIIMNLPDESEEEFILMIPFTPKSKDNMIAWMAAKSDSEYGKLVIYKFPKEELIYGPMQLEARIDQNEKISQQLTLWGQKGSRVIRGNLLVIPIGKSLLYVEPLYILAEKSQMPELKRVIVSFGTKIVMEKDLQTALSEVFDIPEVDMTAEHNQSYESLIDLAVVYYDRVQDAMDQQDWILFGEQMDLLQDVMQKIKDSED